MNVRYPIYTHHQIPPRDIEFGCAAERRSQAARDSLLPSADWPVSYDLPGKKRITSRSQTAWERLRLFLADVAPVYVCGMAGTFVLCWLADVACQAWFLRP